MKKVVIFFLCITMILSLSSRVSADAFTTEDALMALRATAGLIILTAEQTSRLDLNNDNIITSFDALMILRIIAGLPATPPPTPPEPISAPAVTTTTITTSTTSTQNIAITSTYYWVPNGTVYHSTNGCRSLARSRDINSGAWEQIPRGRTACKNCF